MPTGVPVTLVASLSDSNNTASRVDFIISDLNGPSVIASIPVTPQGNYSTSYVPPSSGVFEVSLAVTDKFGQ